MKSIYEFLLGEHLLKSKTVSSTQGNDYVDLGLPSGLLWATRNIGADEPTDYGNYFMWGSTEPDTHKPCNWRNCPFNTGYGSYNAKYFKSVQNEVCPNGILAPEYDAVRTIMGGNWRMPTNDDFNELLNNTTNAWVTNYQNSNINGTLFTSKTDDSKTLFISAAGSRSESSFSSRGNSADLWSSSLNTSYPNCAMSLYFSASFCGMCYDISRFYGFCLRGVKEK